MKTRRKKFSNLTPVITALMLLAVLGLIVWVIPRTDIFVQPATGSLCGKTLQTGLVLDHDLACSDRELGKTAQNESYMMRITASDVVLDCQNHKLHGQGGVGVLVKDADNVTIKNCRFTGVEKGVAATNTEGLKIIDSTFTPSLGAIEVDGGKNTRIAGCQMDGSNPTTKWGMKFYDCSATSVENNTLEGFRIERVDQAPAPNTP